jgi:hypothetical protein
MYSFLLKAGALQLYLLFIASTLVPAQNYRAIRTDSEYFFLDSARLDIISIRIDSTRTIGNDIHYYNFKQIRQLDYGCFTVAGSSWLGDEVTEKPDGTFIFTRYPFAPPDSAHIFHILTQSAINQPWRLYNFHTSADYIEAKLSEIRWMSFLNHTDSVRVITLMRKNAAGQIIEDWMNGQKLLISKNYGLIRLIKFDDTYYTIYGFYDLAGKTNPETGITNLRTMQIYDFAPGDEFHTRYYARSYLTPAQTTTISTINRVLNKTTFPAGDSVTYTIEQCQSSCIALYATTTCEHRFDTITLTYSAIKTPELETQPLETASGLSNGSWATYSYMGLMPLDTRLPIFNIPMKYLRSGQYWTENAGCYSPITYDGCIDAQYYFKGLGGPYYYCNDVSWGPSNLLVYYKKGSLAWGTPLTCDSLLQVAVKDYPAGHKLCIYPNPGTRLITISAPDGLQYPCRLVISDLSGKKVAEFSVNSQSQSINIEKLIPGLYSCRLITQEGEIFSGKIIRL